MTSKVKKLVAVSFAALLLTITVVICDGWEDAEISNFKTVTQSEQTESSTTEKNEVVSDVEEAETEKETEATTRKETTEATENIHTEKKKEPEKETSYIESKPHKYIAGNFRITVYTPSSDKGRWGYSTATGVTSQHLRTCAVDPSVIPLGSTIRINGKEFKAVDTGSAVKGNIVDIFFDGTEYEAADWLNWFGEYHEVEIL